MFTEIFFFSSAYYGQLGHTIDLGDLFWYLVPLAQIILHVS